jgi:hypothetical protein
MCDEIDRDKEVQDSCFMHFNFDIKGNLQSFNILDSYRYYFTTSHVICHANSEYRWWIIAGRNRIKAE